MGITHTPDNHQPLKLLYTKGRCPGNPTPSSNMSVNIHENTVSAAILSKREEGRGEGEGEGTGTRRRSCVEDINTARGLRAWERQEQGMGKEYPQKAVKRIFTPEASLLDLSCLLTSSKQALLLLAHVCNPRECSIAKKIFVCISFIHLEMWYLLPLKCTRKLYMLLRSGYHWSVLAQGIFLLFEIQVLCLLFFSQTIPV